MSILKISSENSNIGEGPFWDVSSQRLYYVDIPAQSVLKFDPTTGLSETRKFDDTVSFAITRKDNSDDLILGFGRKLAIYNWANESLNVVAEVDQNKLNNQFNDGKCDPDGNLWAGTLCKIFGGDFEEGLPSKLKELGSLYRLDAKRNVEAVVQDIGLANGLEWSLDKGTMFYIDSFKATVDAFDVSSESNYLGNRRTVLNFKTFPKGYGLPDGMTIDAEGKLWVACCTGGKVIRLDPETGKVLQTLLFPTQNPTSCCFGGPDFRDLFVTSGKFDANSTNETDGHLFRVTELGVRGLPATSYAG